MGQIDNILEKLNTLMAQYHFPNVEPAADISSLFKNAIHTLWKATPNPNDRDAYAHEIADIMTPFLGAKNTGAQLEVYSQEYNLEYPADLDFVETYNLCTQLYQGFLDSFIQRNVFEFEKLEVIIKKLLIITKKHKADLVSHIAMMQSDTPMSVKHGLNSTILALITGDVLKLNEKQLRELALVGLLHDIGMLKIPAEILNKEGKLTEEEYKTIKTHPIISYKLINEKNIFGKDVLSPIIQHHEQFDGNGYPRQLPGEKIHVFAKIMAIADTFEAQISDRAYRKSKNGYTAMKEVLADSANRFDPKILRAFLSILSMYPPGTIVQLNNKCVATVISINQSAPMRPSVKVLLDEEGQKPQTPRIIDLKTAPTVFIVKVLDKSDINKS